MELTRRSFLALAGSTVGAPLAEARGQRAHSTYGPFRMGIQSYSLRGLDFERALQATRELGLSWWEGWEGHVAITSDLARRSEARLKLREAGVSMRTFGVVSFGADEARARAVFEFAQAMGITTLTADPAPESFPILDQLTRQFGVDIAIHNHGPGSRYDKIEDVHRAIRHRGARFGACVDTGHYLRSREDPVKAIETFGKRVYGVHLKDVAGATRFTVLGKGDLDVRGTLRALGRLGYSRVLSLEHEENPRDPIPDLRECLEAVRRAL